MSGFISFYLTYFLLFACTDRIVSESTIKCDEFGNKLQHVEGLHCETQCEKPMTCVNETNAESWWFALPNLSPPFCRCLPPYKNDRIRQKCYRDSKCADDEILEDYECVKRCSLDSYRSNGKCLKFALLGQSCSEREQCKTAFADCQNGTCECVHGFTALDGTACQTQNFGCPFGDPLRGAAGKLAECGDEIGIGCPIGYTCVFGGASSTTLEKFPRGHCCPDWKRKCPIGEPHPNATCHSTNKPSEPGQTRCPEKTHYCYDVQAGWNATELPLCCPKACSQDKQFVNGQCIHLRALDESCQFDVECADKYAALACKQGRCACADGYAPVFNEYDKTTKCVIQCGVDEHNYPWLPKTCFKSKKLGEPCNPEDGHVHGCRSSKCSTETKTCECECNEVQIDEYSCVPRPVFSRVPWRQTNFTFCRTKYANMTTEVMSDRVVEKCPSDSYCAKHASTSPFGFGNLKTVGVCTPKTEPLCPDGSKGIRKCDPSKTNSCGNDDMKCHQHTEDISVDADPTESHICCKDLVNQLRNLLKQ